MNITLSPTYVPLIQKPKCCAVTCLQMILYRNGFGLFDQEDLAIRFGVKIAADDAPAFRADMPVMTSANVDEGIATVESAPQMNSFFQSLSVPLVATAYKASTIASVNDFIAEHLHENHDV